MKLRNTILIIALIIIADQALKVWIKTSFPFGDTGITGQNWFKLYFIENKGMAWGWEFGGEWGKMLLTLFRLGAVIFWNMVSVQDCKAEIQQGIYYMCRIDLCWCARQPDR